MGQVRSCAFSPAQRKRVALRYAFQIWLFSVLLGIALVYPYNLLLSSIDAQLHPLDPLYWAAIWAVMSAIWVAPSTYFTYRNLLDPNYEGSPSLNRTRRYLVLSLPYPEAFQHCLDSLSVFDSPCIVLEDMAQGRVEVALLSEPILKGFITFKGMGHRITFRLGSDEEGITKVVVISKPGSSQSIDYGRNERNVKRVAAFLQENTIASPRSAA